jgi:hypothetical protein
MKKALLIIINFLFLGQINGQHDEKCLPKKLIVAAENLNFRTEPNTKSKTIGKLENSELLTFIKLLREENDGYWSGISNSWIKVERVQTGEIGYVFGKYVKSQEMAYMNYHDADRIQKGNWYGIFQEGNKVKIEKSSPKISELDEGFNSIVANNEKHKILICSQTEIKEGEINGKLFDNQREYLQIGIQKRLIRIGDFEFSLACTGEVELKQGWMTRKNEKIIFQKMEFDGSQRHYSQQDLTECILQYGEVGYMIHFAGDLNNDGIPELIISEGTTHGGTVYYFQSNEKGELELASITGVSSNC